jgi:hypothetical protein
MRTYRGSCGAILDALRRISGFIVMAIALRIRKTRRHNPRLRQKPDVSFPEALARARGEAAK